MTELLDGLRATIERDGGPLAAELREPAEDDPGLGELTAAGERAAADRQQYAMVVESVFEGYLLHYRRPRLTDGDDPDLALLGGDFLYASGLTRLTQLGDIEAIQDLADLITLCAQLHAPADVEPDEQLVAALWCSTALAIGGGRWPDYERLKQAVRAGNEGDSAAATECARQRAASLGLDRELERALIAFRKASSAGLRTT